MRSVTTQAFVQRGNYPTFAVVWDGEMDDNILDFLLSRGVHEYWTPDSPDGALVLRAGIHFKVVDRGTWLVDQGGLPEEIPFQFVECNEDRFRHLYREVSPGEEAT